MAEILSKVVERPIDFRAQSLDEVRDQFEDMAIMYEWLDNVGFSADIPSLRDAYPAVEWLSFEQWARAQSWAQLLG